MGRLADAFWNRTYPDAPGHKGAETSRLAAEAVDPLAGNLRGRVLAEFDAAGEGGLTADEAAAALGRPVLAVRPRVAELVRTGRLERTGRRRPNPDSGLQATVWRRRKNR